MKVMRTPKTVDLDITNRCNLRCKYCYHFASAGDVDQDLPTEEWLRFFEELNRCAVLNVCIGGGEPFIRKDITDFIEGIVRNRMRFSMLSNGTLITDELARFLASTGRCDSVQVSIDGAAPEAHDACRGEGGFEKAVRGLQSLQQNNVPATVRVTIHRHNVADLENIARLLLEDLGLAGFSTNAAGYLGICRSHADEIQLTVADRHLAMETLLKLNKKYNGRIKADAGPLYDARHWLKMERARREKRSPFEGCGHLRACGGVFTKLAVRADGVMVPCNMMGHVELGRINQDDLETVWQRHPELIRLRRRRNIPLGEFEFCRGCGYQDYCRGNCPALAYTILGEENHPSPDACIKRYLEDGGLLPDSRLSA